MHKWIKVEVACLIIQHNHSTHFEQRKSKNDESPPQTILKIMLLVFFLK